MILDDGTGSGNKAKIDKDNRLYTNSVTREEVDFSIFLGNGYNINTGLVSITNAGVDNAIWYLKNTGSDDVVIYEVLIILGTTTGGVGDGTLKVFRNPTTGTIVSSALAVEANVNRNFASSNQLEVLTYKGATASTITDGVTLGSTNRSGASVINFTSTPFILKTGNSIGVTWAAATSNTSQSVRIATTAFVRTNEI